MILHKRLFFLIVFLLPLNLGKHFVFDWCYVDFALKDYLVPTIYVTDLLILWLLVVWFYASRKSLFSRLYRCLVSSSALPLVLFFVFCVFLSVLSATHFYPAFYAFLHLLLYVLFFLYVVDTFEWPNDLHTFAKTVCLSVFFLSILGIFQWNTQGSVFDNYLFFGEQPYSISTRGITRENFLGFTRVPSYGTFRHPNVFGAYLCSGLLWVLFLVHLQKDNFFWRYFGFLVILLGSIALFFTLSKFTWFVFAFSIISFVCPARCIKLLLLCLFLFLGLCFLLPLLPIASLSLARRSDLLIAALHMIKSAPLFGMGLNNSTILIDDFLIALKRVKFGQPVHNIFLLIFAESGLFALFFFIAFLYTLFKSVLTDKFLFILMLQLLLLGAFDHYFFTIHQAQLLLWLTLAICLKYTLYDEK